MREIQRFNRMGYASEDGIHVRAETAIAHVNELADALRQALACVEWFRRIAKSPNDHLTRIDQMQDRCLDILQEYRPDQPLLDKCTCCGGWQGGVPGNENIVDDKAVCDYCSVEIMKS